MFDFGASAWPPAFAGATVVTAEATLVTTEAKLVTTGQRS